MFYNARYYDPLTSRFTSADTIVPNPTNPQDYNRYTYVRNSPAKYTDSSGHTPGTQLIPLIEGGGRSTSQGGYSWTGNRYVQDDGLGTIKLKGYVAPGVEQPDDHVLSYQGVDMDEIHLLLDLYGVVPVAGMFFDGLNGLIYLGEGDVLNAGISGVAFIPGIGLAAPGGRQCAKHCDEVADLLSGARQCFKSFAADTEVLMADGSTKRISEIEIGDFVWAHDPETGEAGPRAVTHLWVHEDTLVDFKVGDSWVTTTEDHPWWNQTDKEWQEAQDLGIGDLVLTADGGTLVVGGIDWETRTTGSAYNLSIDEIHTYFVGAGAELVLVHNICGDALVSDILSTRRASIRRAPLPPGSPTWDEIANMTFAEIQAGARANKPGFRTIKKLLTDGRFAR